MKTIFKNITNNWFIFFGYLSLFLLTVIAALQIYDANYNITSKYKELAEQVNSKLMLLLKTRQNVATVQSITIDKAFHPDRITAGDESRLKQLTGETNADLAQYTVLAERGQEAEALRILQQAWQINNSTSGTLISLHDRQERAVQYYESTQRNTYEKLKAAISSLSMVVTNEIKTKEAAASNYFKKSIVFINILIGVRVAILIVIGIIIVNVVAGLRAKNNALRQAQTKLLQNQAHLLASQEISKTGSWELELHELDRINENRVTWSDETYRIFGYQPGQVEVNNELFFSHVPEQDQLRIANAVRHSIETGIPYEIEHEIVLKTGEVKIIYERSDIFYDDEGRPRKMIGTCQDITERKHAEQKLVDSEKEKHRLRDQITKQKILRQKEITRATIKAQEKERLELGRELHDNVNQILSSSKLFVENALHNPEKNQEMLHRSKALINTCIHELRKLSRFLAPPSLGDLTLAESIDEIVKEYNQIEGRRTVECSVTGLNEDDLSEDLKISIYRIIQEQLNNIRKHAGASSVRVFLRHGSHNISLNISDNGCGFDTRQKRKGLGLTNIINRAETFNGGVRIISSPGNGCSIFVNFKLPAVPAVNAGPVEQLPDPMEQDHSLDHPMDGNGKFS